MSKFAIGLDPRAGAAQGLAIASAPALRRLGQIATRASTPDYFLNTKNQMMSRTVHTLRDSAPTVILAFANWHCQNAGGEQSSGGTMTLTVGIEYPIGATPRRVTFGGNSSVAIPGLGTVFSDEFQLGGLRGDQFAVKTYQTNAAGVIYSGGRNGTDEGYTAAVSGVADDTLTTNNPTLTNLAYAPAAILGYTMRPAIYIAGDSKANGTGESINKQDPGGLAGEIERSIGRHLAFINGSCPSDTVAAAVGGYSRRAALAAYCTHVICNYGINDLHNSRTASQVLADLQSLQAAIGIPMWQLTVSPRTSSTDSWATVANQTVWDATKGAQRIALNKLLRKSPKGLGVFDTADVVESARDSGLWKAAYSGDGLHENDAGYLSIEQSHVLDANLFFRHRALT